MIEDQIAHQVLADLSEIAGHVNGTYEAINTRSASVEEVRAQVTLMRARLDRIEKHIVNSAILQGVKS